MSSLRSATKSSFLFKCPVTERVLERSLAFEGSPLSPATSFIWLRTACDLNEQRIQSMATCASCEHHIEAPANYTDQRTVFTICELCRLPKEFHYDENGRPLNP